MNHEELIRATEVIKALRDPKTGCSWDLKQTHQSLLKYLIEESYEFIEATESGNFNDMNDELGDVLLQVLLHAQIASENNHFDLESVAKNLSDKMIRRHPHVFGDVANDISNEEIIKNWEQIKAEENKERPKYFFKQKDVNLPALSASYKIGKKSKQVNFDWNDYKEVLAKVDEELQEVKDELTSNINKDKVKEEIGDLLFSVAQLSRHLDIDPEEALKSANKKFINRFNKIEDLVKSENKEISDYSNAQLEELWLRIKTLA